MECQGGLCSSPEPGRGAAVAQPGALTSCQRPLLWEWVLVTELRPPATVRTQGLEGLPCARGGVGKPPGPPSVEEGVQMDHI